jgi:apolipoprotein N-acyltransferase
MNGLSRVSGAVLSGLLLALAGSLHPVWAAAWIASVAVLVAACRSRGASAWWLGFVAGLIGGVSIVGYYAKVAGIPIALVITVLKALLYAGGVRFACGSRVRLPAAIAVFAFPAWFAAFDTVIAALSADGTAGSLAYSQLNFPVAVQVASLGGAPAVTFIVCLCSSVLAELIVGAESPRRVLTTAAPGVVVLAAALGFGAWRISTAPADPNLAVSLAALDQASAMPTDWRASVDAYRPLMAQARASGASLMVLPEEIAVASAGELPSITKELGDFSQRSNLILAVGFRIADHGKLRNVLLFLTPDGRVLTYDKQHLVPGLEIPKIAPGKRPALIAEFAGYRIGGAICKDFDFVDVGRSLGISRAGLVVAPAWDFGVDAWLHGRMAMFRAVEGGFTLVRSAREGAMSVSDRYGRVLAEAPSGPAAPLLLANAPVSRGEVTFYARAGDLFGWLCAAFVLSAVFPGLTRRLRKGDAA